MPRVAQAQRRHGAGVDGADGERLLELRPARDDVALTVDRHAVAVEHELVLAADHVAEQDDRRVVAGALDQHALALERLAGVVRRGRQVHDPLPARERLGRGGRARLPDVLADRQADRHAVQLDQRGLRARLEVARLVEDAVVGQEHLAVDRLDAALGEYRTRVVYVLTALGEADEGHQVAVLGLARELLERGARAVHEVRLQEEVLGRVAGQGQLGEHDELRALVARAADPLLDLPGVALDVAHGGVDLGERDPQRLGAHGHGYNGTPRGAVRRVARGAAGRTGSPRSAPPW